MVDCANAKTQEDHGIVSVANHYSNFRLFKTTNELTHKSVSCSFDFTVPTVFLSA
jgi:hypothetical protein